jgi:hypothetical protein
MPSFHWLLEKMLPDVHAIFCAGDAAPRQTEELRKQSQCQTPLTHDEGLPVRTILGPLALGPEIVCYDKKVCGYDRLGGSHDSQFNRIYCQSPGRDLGEFRGEKTTDP